MFKGKALACLPALESCSVCLNMFFLSPSIVGLKKSWWWGQQCISWCLHIGFLVKPSTGSWLHSPRSAEHSTLSVGYWKIPILCQPNMHERKWLFLGFERFERFWPKIVKIQQSVLLLQSQFSISQKSIKNLQNSSKLYFQANKLTLVQASGCSLSVVRTSWAIFCCSPVPP